MTDTGNAFTSGPPTPGIPVVTGVLLTLAHVFMFWRNAGYRFRLTRSLCGQECFQDDAPRGGQVTLAPVRTTRSSRVAVTSAAVVLLLAAIPSELLGAQRIEGALPEHATFHHAVTESIHSGDEKPSQARSTWWGSGLEMAELKLNAGKLGPAASKAVNRWPAAQRADPAWEWAKILVFLIQSALAVQGLDSGKPDGVMGPKTMMALVEWYTKKREPGLPSIAEAVAHLLHDTLTAIGLAPGPRDGILGWKSKTALKPWDRTFGRSAMIIETSEDVAKRWIMEGFGKTPSAGAEESGNQAAGREPAGRSNASGQSTHECVNFSWWEKTPFCDDHVAGPGKCRWILFAHNTCAYEVWVHFLVNAGGEHWNITMWQDDHLEIGQNWAVPEGRSTGGEGVWDIPQGVQLKISYCVNRDYEYATYGDYAAQTAKKRWEWYRNEPDVGAVNTKCLADD